MKSKNRALGRHALAVLGLGGAFAAAAVPAAPSAPTAPTAPATPLAPAVPAAPSATMGSIAPDPVPANPEKGPYLFCYFLGNGDGLHLASSMDGLTFTPIGGANKIFLRPDIGVNNDGSTANNHLMRDPCIRQGPDGMYHVVWTTGWYQRGFGTASSPDLVHWSEQKYVEAMKHEPTAFNTWAPELFYDDAKKQWLIFWASTIPAKFTETIPTRGGDRGGGGVLNHRMYYVTTKDFQTFSDTKLLYDPGFNCIDATMQKIPSGKYMMVIKDETVAPTAAKNLRMAFADSPEGPWGKASAPISPPTLWVEGPTINRVNDEWYVFYDAYRNSAYGAIKTKDFEKWEVVQGTFSMPRGSRHGTVLPTTQAVIDRLKKEFPG
jgi:hypothetical protein